MMQKKKSKDTEEGEWEKMTRKQIHQSAPETDRFSHHGIITQNQLDPQYQLDQTVTSVPLHGGIVVLGKARTPSAPSFRSCLLVA